MAALYWFAFVSSMTIFSIFVIISAMKRQLVSLSSLLDYDEDWMWDDVYSDVPTKEIHQEKPRKNTKIVEMYA